MPRFPLLTAALIASTSFATASAQTWQPLGAPEGGSLFRFVQVDDTLIASASMTTYRSTDAGASWSPIDTLPPLVTLSTSAVVGNTIVALFPSAGVYSSSDEGITWTQVTDAVTSEQFSTLAAIGSSIIARTGAGELFRSDNLGVDWSPIKRPNDTMALQMGTDATRLTICEFTDVYTSDDLGETWQTGFTLPQASMIELYPAGATAQFAFIRDFINASTGFYRSTDGGLSWTLLNNTPADIQEVESVRRFDGGLVALTRTGSGSYFPMLSTDDGISWTQIPTPPNDYFSAVGSFDSTLFLTGQQGLSRSDNLGTSWTPSNTGTFSVGVGALASSGHAAYANANGRTTLFRSTDALTWLPHHILPSAISFIYSTAPGATPDQDELFVSLSNLGLHRSTDGGTTFTPVNNGIPEYPLNDGAIRMVVDLVRVNPTTLIIAVQGSSRPGRHGVGGSTYGAEGFIRSTNNGASWSQSNSGFPTIGINEIFQANWDQITHLAVLSNATVIATTRTLGIWRSTNAGASWQQVNTGVPTCSGVRPAFGDLITLGNDVFASIDSIGSGCPNLPTQVLKSSDSGATWTPASNGMPITSRAGRMSVIDGKLNIVLRPTLGGYPEFWESVDAGATWTPSASSPQYPLTAPHAVKDVPVAGTVFTGLWALVPPPACPGDTNANGSVDGADLSVLLSQFGTSVKPGSGADLNNDGVINSADLSVLLANFGNNC